MVNFIFTNILLLIVHRFICEKNWLNSRNLNLIFGTILGVTNFIFFMSDNSSLLYISDFVNLVDSILVYYFTIAFIVFSYFQRFELLDNRTFFSCTILLFLSYFITSINNIVVFLFCIILLERQYIKIFKTDEDHSTYIDHLSYAQIKSLVWVFLGILFVASTGGVNIQAFTINHNMYFSLFSILFMVFITLHGVYFPFKYNIYMVNENKGLALTFINYFIYQMSTIVTLVFVLNKFYLKLGPTVQIVFEGIFVTMLMISLFMTIVKITKSNHSEQRLILVKNFITCIALLYVVNLSYQDNIRLLIIILTFMFSALFLLNVEIQKNKTKTNYKTGDLLIFICVGSIHGIFIGAPAYYFLKYLSIFKNGANNYLVVLITLSSLIFLASWIKDLSGIRSAASQEDPVKNSTNHPVSPLFLNFLTIIFVIMTITGGFILEKITRL